MGRTERENKHIQMWLINVVLNMNKKESTKAIVAMSKSNFTTESDYGRVLEAYAEYYHKTQIDTLPSDDELIEIALNVTKDMAKGRVNSGKWYIAGAKMVKLFIQPKEKQ